jgi:hypothetical protein
LRAWTGIGDLLKAYFLFTHDTRYSTPTLHVVTAEDDEAALVQARERLDGSPHHLLVEIWEDNRAVGQVGRNSEPDSPA